MNAVPFKGSNDVLRAAPGTEDQVNDLHIFRGQNLDGYPYVVSCWVPTKEDLEALSNGGGVFLLVMGSTHPPVCCLGAKSLHDAARLWQGH